VLLVAVCADWLLLAHFTVVPTFTVTDNEGRTTFGSPTHVFPRGKLIVENEEWLGKAGAGRFIKRGPLTAR